jgi:hypothetical protein
MEEVAAMTPAQMVQGTRVAVRVWAYSAEKVAAEVATVVHLDGEMVRKSLARFVLDDSKACTLL